MRREGWQTSSKHVVQDMEGRKEAGIEKSGKGGRLVDGGERLTVSLTPFLRVI